MEGLDNFHLWRPEGVPFCHGQRGCATKIYIVCELPPYRVKTGPVFALKWIWFVGPLILAVSTDIKGQVLQSHIPKRRLRLAGFYITAVSAPKAPKSYFSPAILSTFSLK